MPRSDSLRRKNIPNLRDIKYETAMFSVTPSQQYPRTAIYDSGRADAKIKIGVTGRKNMGNMKITKL